VTRVPASGATEAPKRIPQLDGLRGLAILLVLLLHYFANTARGQQAIVYKYFARIFGMGWAGVDLFFVLSGFLIGGILLDARSSERYFSTFYLRRIHRIFPLYYLWLVLFLLFLFLGFTVGGLPLEFSALDLSHFPRYLVFVQNFFHQKGPLEIHWLSQMWSLAVEEQFYLIAPLLVRFLSVRRLTQVLLGTILFAPVLRYFVLGYVDHGSVYAVMSMPCRADDLAIGILAAVAIRSAWFPAFLARHPRFLSTLFLCTALGMCGWTWWFMHPSSLPSTTLGLSWLGLFWLSLMLMVLCQPAGWIARIFRWRFLQRAGVLSYCIYIAHSSLNEILHRTLRHDTHRMDDWKGVLVTALAALLVWLIASFSWKYLENPLLRRGRRYSY
jgi:peptidoglycan/LPS O-acetylase OafA/YrhL